MLALVVVNLKGRQRDVKVPERPALLVHDETEIGPL